MSNFLPYFILGAMVGGGFIIFLWQMLQLDKDLVALKVTQDEAGRIQGRFYASCFGIMFFILGALLLIWTIARDIESLKAYVIP